LVYDVVKLPGTLKQLYIVTGIVVFATILKVDVLEVDSEMISAFWTR
jgi:hypothetical protein